MKYNPATLQLALGLAGLAHAAPPGFPSSGNGLWYNTVGTIWSRHFLPVGNGFLGATTGGGTTQESTQLNIESLWSGGPFADPAYNGGNKQPNEQDAMAEAMRTYRQNIMKSPNGTIDDVNKLDTDIQDYGSYSGAGFLTSTLSSSASNIENYGRFLDLDQGIVTAVWDEGNSTITRSTFCSHPAQACAQNTSTTNPTGFTQTYSFVALAGLPPPNVTCADNATLRLDGHVADPGMAYELLARVSASPGGKVVCASVPHANGTAGVVNATITVSGANSASVVWVGGTEFDPDAGDLAHGFSFVGPAGEPHASLNRLLASASPPSQSYANLLATHIADYTSILHSKFSLSLGQTPDLETPTDALKAQYEVDKGDPYLEWVLFNYGRHMLASAARGVLPANLQGKWAFDVGNPWSADYHSNINLQMNYWAAESTNLDVTESLFDYLEKNWAPRGAYTAQVLYNITRGWVTHDEMNIFGYTGMKGGGNTAQWADYPESNAWMMIHVWDHFDYTNDVAWWKAQGYPLLKGVASFHLDKLIPDEHFNDGTLVVAPCNSPEQIPITMACAHAQQLLWQLFNAVEKGAEAAGETDEEFLNEVEAKKKQMDKGVHIGSWGQLQEWKVDMDQQNDTHRHLSHLVGLYPGYAIASYSPDIQNPEFTTAEVQHAAQISLIHRGNGTGPDADSGWEKVWRAACWAQFGNAEEFYHELTYALQRDFAENLFSIYDPGDVDPIFQIDANLGFPAAVMNALIQAPDVASTATPLSITILPALPPTWPSGSIKGARVRGGITVDVNWAGSKPSSVVLSVDESVVVRPVRVVYNGKVKASFNTTGGLVETITDF